jgi:hypothetical protein
MSESTPTGTIWAFLGCGVLALVVTLIALALSLTGKLSMGGAKLCLLAAWIICVLGIYSFTPVFRSPATVRILFAISLGAALGLGFYYLSEWMCDTSTSTQNGSIAPQLQSNIESAEAARSREIADQGKRIDKLTEAFTRNPSIEADSRLSILKDENERLAKKEELTKAQKDTLKGQALNLQSLEEGRKHYADTVELEKRQQDNAAQQRVIEQQQAARREEAQQKKFATRFAPVFEYAIGTLHEMLSEIAKQSSELISTDFPGDRPSIYNSTILKDGKFQKGGHHVIRVGSHEEWEITITGPSQDASIDRQFFQFNISAGRRDRLRRSTDWYSIITVSSDATPVTTEPAKFNVECLERHGAYSQKILFSENCAESEYQKAIQGAIGALIQDRYNAFQLGKSASPTPPSSTPSKTKTNELSSVPPRPSPKWSSYTEPRAKLGSLIQHGEALWGRWKEENDALLKAELEGLCLRWFSDTKEFVKTFLTEEHLKRLSDKLETTPGKIYEFALELNRFAMTPETHPTPYELGYKLTILRKFQEEMG